MSPNELREKSLNELKEILKELRMEAFNLRWQKVSAEFKENHKFKQIRRNIARILTVIAEGSYKTA